MKYFAYGSNCNPAVMKRKGVSFTSRQRAVLRGFRLLFNKKATRASLPEDIGFANINEAQSADMCAALFADALGGAPLLTNRSVWRQFPKLWCRRWVAGNRVLLGDAAHTAHFSIGSGTRLAMEDAIALARAIADNTTLEDALSAYEAERIPIAEKIVTAANTSAAWYDQFARKMALAPLDFAFDYITRSGRVDMDRLRQLSPNFMTTYEAHTAEIS